MLGRSLNIWEISAAFVVFALGLFLIWQGSSYPLGSLTRMGPGYFPVALGVILLGFGAALIFEVRRHDSPPPDLKLRPFIMITTGLIAFVLMLDRFGLVPAAVALVVLECACRSAGTAARYCGTAVVIAGIGYFVFIRGFGLQLAAFNW
jgi:hypothetical protein